MRIALAQLNPVIGDVAGNADEVLGAIEHARRDTADVLVTSELVLTGYPPRDLLLREGVVEACEAAVERIARASGDMHVIVGHPRRSSGGSRPLCNSASVCHAGRVVAVADKQLLPGYDVFDEDRYFEPGGRSLVVPIKGHRVGILICEDLWRADDVAAAHPRYAAEPVAALASQGCDLIISLNASPFVTGKWRRHVEQMTRVATDLSAPVIAVNQVGGNDDLVFDGRSLVVGSSGAVASVLSGFRSELRTIQVPLSAGDQPGDQWNDWQREVFGALVLGVHDYIIKTGNRQAIVGLSGGIDSALTAVIAAAAVGAGNVHGVMMPSRYSSSGSIDDAIELARHLSLPECRRVPIETVHQAMHDVLEEGLGAGQTGGVVDENVQARLRGVILMAMSNSLAGSLVLATSNKSEIATGYSTLYGDMCGAIAVLGDLTKTRIYELSRWINVHYQECGFPAPPIPQNSLLKPPSAELRPNQTDQDTLPPYEVLDQIIERYIEQEQSVRSIIDETGLSEELVRRTALMIDRAQYKRDQAPVILKLTGRAFGRGRPMPIVMKPPTMAGDRAADPKRPETSASGDSVQRTPRATVPRSQQRLRAEH